MMENNAVCALLLMTVALLCAGSARQAVAGEPPTGPSGELKAEEVNLLLSRLDLDRPGLDKVKAATADPQKAAAALLEYYRTREGIVHPEVDRSKRQELRGQYADEKQMAIADDALMNILITSPKYPRHDFGDKLDWLTNQSPNGDLEWTWQLNRHDSWLFLGMAYWHTGDEKYPQAYARQLAHWMAQCGWLPKPHNTAWRMIETGIRGRAWTVHWMHFVDSPHYSPTLLVRQLNCLYDHADYLTRGRDFTRNNWGLMEAQGSAHIAAIFPEFKDSDAWWDKAIEYLVAETTKQVLPDGMHKELCFGYHSGSIYWFNRTMFLARVNGQGKRFPPAYEKTVEKMYLALARCQHPDGHRSMFGDDPQAKVTGQVKMGAEQFPENPYLKFLASGGSEGEAPPTAFILPDAGLYSLRNSWDEDAIHLIMKCGPDGGWHCQPDNGTFELYAYGRLLMPDSGCYIYHGDDEGRKWFRQTRVHQTLTLDGKDSAYDPKLLLWKPGEHLDAVVVSNGSYENLTHRRAVFFVDRRFFVLVDDAIGQAAGDIDLNFQLIPGEAIFDKDNLSVRTNFADGANVMIKTLPQQGLTLHQEEGQVSYIYSKKEPRPALRFHLPKTAETTALRFVTLILPYKAGHTPEASAKLIDSPPGSNKVSLLVTVDGEEYRLGYDLDQQRAWLENQTE